MKLSYRIVVAVGTIALLTTIFHLGYKKGSRDTAAIWFGMRHTPCPNQEAIGNMFDAMSKEHHENQRLQDGIRALVKDRNATVAIEWSSSAYGRPPHDDDWFMKALPTTFETSKYEDVLYIRPVSKTAKAYRVNTVSDDAEEMIRGLLEEVTPRAAGEGPK